MRKEGGRVVGRNFYKTLKQSTKVGVKVGSEVRLWVNL